MSDEFYFWSFIFICLLILILCCYQISKWFKNNKLDLYQGIDLDNYITGHLLHNINKFKIKTSLMLLLSIILLSFVAKFIDIPKGIIVALLFGACLLGIYISNKKIAKIWRCPFCNEVLPTIVGRGGLRAKLSEKCPHCGKSLMKQE